MTNTINHKRTKTITIANTELKGGMEICLPSGGAVLISGVVYPSGVINGTMAVETELGNLYLDRELSSTVLDPDVTQPMASYHHLLVVQDGTLEINELFTNKRAMAQYLMRELRGGDLGVTRDDYLEAIAAADQDAAQGDHMEGVTPKIPGDPEEYLDCLRDLMSANNLDLYVEELNAPA